MIFQSVLHDDLLAHWRLCLVNLLLLRFLLVKRAQDSDLVVLVLVEVKAVKMSITELKEVVVEGLFGDTDLLGRFFKSDALLSIHSAPFAYLNDNFADDSFFLTAASKSLSRRVAALDQGIRILS